jgi:hypothetical protein
VHTLPDVTDRDVVTGLLQIAAEPHLLNGHNGHAPGSESVISEELKAARIKIGQLEVALEHRTVIAQATGLVMERFRLDPDTAFGVLATLSQHTNRKLFVLSRELVTTREVEGLRQLVREATQDNPGQG